MILFSALERSKDRDRPHHGVIIDEFHNFTRGNTPDHLLAETRKYNVFLTVADQLSFQKAVFGNVGNLVVGRAGAEDADKLSDELGLENQNYLIELPNRHWLLRRSGEDVIRLEGLPPPIITHGPGRVIRRSLENYGEIREEVDERINRFLSKT